MFLHSGASLHGHEYSKKPTAAQAAQAQARRSPLLRSPFSTPLPRSTTPSPTQTKPQTEQQSCLLQRRSEPRLRRNAPDEPIVRFQEPVAIYDDTPIPTPITESISEEDTFSGSEASTAAASCTARRRSKRPPRRADTYLFARPPPGLVKKRLLQHVRPRLLLQLHRLSADCRPTPVVDVYPAAAIAGLARRFPYVFGVRADKTQLGSQDVVLFRSEEYCTAGSCELDDGSLSRRELVAVLSPLRRDDRSEIVLADGAVWLARPLLNGSFELTRTDPDGGVTTARWVRRCVAPAGIPHDRPPSPAAPEDYRYTFSVINPDSRRHPVMATLTRDTLEIQESFTTVSAADRSTYPVDDATRALISATAVWVTLRLGSGSIPAATESPRSPTALRSISSNVRSATPASPATLPKRATSTGASFIQQHRRVFSGDWSGETARKRASSLQSAPSARKARSACFDTTTIRETAPRGEESDDEGAADPEARAKSLRMLEGEGGSESGKSEGKWKRIGQWFRKIGR